jgi:hypothetical protein
MREIPNEVLDFLAKKYNIISHWNFLDFDQNFDVLRGYVKKIQKEQFDFQDRIVVEHMDTDFYIKIDRYHVGVNLRNFFGVMTELDVPHYLFVFYTNHFGIKKEIDVLCQSRSLFDRPTIIETFLSQLHYKPERIYDVDYKADSVSYNMMCMMNLTRSHRNAVYRRLDRIDKNKLLLSGTNANF